MRYMMFLFLPSLTFAAPPVEPKQVDTPGVELKLSAKNADVLEIIIQNNTPKAFELSYRFSPFEHIVVELQGEKGQTHKIRYNIDSKDKEKPGTLTVAAGEAKTFTMHTCHSLPEIGGGDQKVTFSASLKHKDKIIEAKPLTVK